MHRERLLEKVNSVSANLILVSAPAGFGKTTFVGNWLEQSNRTYAWLSLDESDNDLRRFCLYMVAALRSINPSFGAELFHALSSSINLSQETIMTHLINELSTLPEKSIFVLDDYHYIVEHEIHRAVSFLLSNLPSNLSMVIVTRIDPALPLHRMRVRNEVVEIRQRDLRFTTDEAEKFFHLMRLNLSPEDVHRLATRTEGWVAGLQLAALSLHDVQDAHRFIESFTGTNKYVLDYLLTEVLNRQRKEVQMFLLQTAILARFNESVCNAVTGGMDARAILDYLEQSNLFLIPLDEQREWYRYHHLFSELLQHRLRRLYPNLVGELHLNASVWFEEYGAFEEAVHYALRIKNYERAAYLLDRHGEIFLSRSELATLIKYTEQIPEQYSAKYPRLLVTKAWALLLTHRTEDIQNIIAHVEELLNSHGETHSHEEIAEARGHISTIHAFTLRLQGRLSESLMLSKEILGQLPREHSMLRGLIKFNMGRIYMKQGYVALAHETLTGAFEENYLSGNYYVALAILAHTGYLTSIMTSLPVARRKLEEAVRFAKEHRISSLPAAGYIYYQLGRILYHQNNLEDAVASLNRAVHLGELGNEPDVMCNSLFLLASIQAVQGDAAMASATFRRAEAIQSKSSMSIFEVDLQIERLSLALLSGDMDTITEGMKYIDQSIDEEYTVITEARLLLVIRYLIYLNDFERALELVGQVRTKSAERGRTNTILQLDAFEAICLWSMKRTTGAVRALGRCLEKSGSMGYVRVLLNMGEPMYQIVTAVSHDTVLPVSARQFIADLLPLFSKRESPLVPTIPKFKQGLIDPLTEREQEVLFYIHQDLSNKEIASKLYISLDTVKTHVKNIYGKLGVHNRKDAVAQARRAKLL